MNNQYIISLPKLSSIASQLTLAIALVASPAFAAKTKPNESERPAAAPRAVATPATTTTTVYDSDNEAGTGAAASSVHATEADQEEHYPPEIERYNYFISHYRQNEVVDRAGIGKFVQIGEIYVPVYADRMLPGENEQTFSAHHRIFLRKDENGRVRPYSIRLKLPLDEIVENYFVCKYEGTPFPAICVSDSESEDEDFELSES